MTPASFCRRPAIRASRARAAAGSSSQLAASNRSSTAFDTLFTFWPPGPEARTWRNSISSSGIANPASRTDGTAKCSGFAGDAPGYRTGVRHLEPDGTLRHRDGEAVLLEQAPDAAIDVGADVVDAFLRIGDPESQFELDAVIPEAHQTRDGGRLAQDAAMTLGRVQQSLEQIGRASCREGAAKGVRAGGGRT